MALIEKFIYLRRLREFSHLDILRHLAYNPTVTTQYLTDERGEKVAVVIPIADFDALMEDVADLACVAERRDEDRLSLDEVKKQLVADGLIPN